MARGVSFGFFSHNLDYTPLLVEIIILHFTNKVMLNCDDQNSHGLQDQFMKAAEGRGLQ